jgi:HlyD family secretion protein
MTANVTIEIARADNVLRVQNAALRFQPPADAVPPRPADGRGQVMNGDRPNGERGARVWVLSEGQLEPIRVRTGISDGTTTAILDGQLDEQTQVITGIAAAQSTSASPAGGSPLIPQRPGFNRQGGGNGGGATRRPAQGAGR